MKLRETEYPEDVQKIINQLMNKGTQVSVKEAVMLWEDYSSSLCAGWLFVPTEGVEKLVDLTLLNKN